MQEIINLKNIDYSETINKKFIFNNANSSLTLLSFKAGTSRSIHVDENDEVAQIIEGIADITIGKKIYRLQEGEMIVMPGKIPHGLNAITNTKMLLLRPKHTH